MKALRELHPAWIAGIIGVLAALWLASGVGNNKTVTAPEKERSEPPLATVRVVNSKARDLVREASISARTAAVRSVHLRAETSGQVTQVLAQRGDLVTAGQVLIKLAIKDRQAQLDKAQATLKQRRWQYQAAKRLHARGHQSDVDLATAQANLAAAQADLQNRIDDLGATTIRAPFDGVLEGRSVDVGNYVNSGDELGQLMQQQPFLVRGQVTEDVIGYLHTGQAGKALINGRTYPGRLRFAARQADSRTRTFEVELEIDNTDRNLVAGVSAILQLPLNTVRAHELETVMLTLNDRGDFGIKSVDSEGIVHFHEATIAQNRNEKVWLSGLPDELQVISVGQGFVGAGQQVVSKVVGGE